MIFGECPYCGGLQMQAISDVPGWQKKQCTKCQRTYWLHHTRCDPEAMTDEEFREKFEIDEELKQITKKTTGDGR